MFLVISKQKNITDIITENLLKITLLLSFYLFEQEIYSEYVIKRELIQPKISVFIYIYNTENSITNSIKNIQNQTLKEIEIIAVNDCSNDNSLDVIKELAKEDSRIKIVNNKEKCGYLFSRINGIFKSTGEYIMNLYQEGMFEDKYCLEYLYKSTKNSKIDIISFGLFNKEKKSLILKCPNIFHIHHQPELFLSAFNSSNLIEDNMISNKLIKKDIYQKIFDDFKEIISETKYNYFEDDILSILVHKYANILRCLDKVIYRYNENSDSLINNRFNKIDLNVLINRNEIFTKIFNSSEYTKYLQTEILRLLDYITQGNNSTEIMNDNSKNQIKNILDNFLKNYKCQSFIKIRINKVLNTIS